MAPNGKVPAREAKGRQTRERLLGAAIGEFKRGGMAGADVGEIVAAAGVAHATFYFHFPTKEHVLLELERREEQRMATELSRFFRKPHRLTDTLTEVIHVLDALNRRLGSRLFKDLLTLHFSTTRPPEEEFTDHPVIVAVVDDIERARDRGEVPPGTDAFHSGVFYLLGLYALLITTPDEPSVRTPLLDKYVATALRGMGSPQEP
ncbi:TetR/AcrR family transcriptional regulator [Nocardia sp. BMG51109]|uniref:TetR/AcrR family transcriptional regulator n=1 Tax=Nocardia sp. BMG51109 TaxID=1056816 RepID=UPI000463A7BF|nr:TetR/AcrR family transcriptional regulator [Nocardia sp. BMG51109]